MSAERAMDHMLQRLDTCITGAFCIEGVLGSAAWEEERPCFIPIEERDAIPLSLCIRCTNVHLVSYSSLSMNLVYPPALPKYHLQCFLGQHSHKRLAREGNLAKPPQKPTMLSPHLQTPT
jgi:hypothetical protein